VVIFFFQAEDGIRDRTVTGVQTCALPISAGAPQGSFTNHFRSKEAFAEEVLDQYFDYLKGLVKQALNDETRTPRQRLKRYLDIKIGRASCRERVANEVGDVA